VAEEAGSLDRAISGQQAIRDLTIDLREWLEAGRATLIGEKAQATLRGRPRGRLGSGGLAPAALRGRPGLLGSTQATGATLYIKSSRIRQM
jgi:hypothetical protein